MKRLMVVLIVGAMTMVASADLTGWNINGGKLYNNDSVLTISGVEGLSIAGDITGLIVGGTIDESVLLGALGSTTLGFVPVGPAAGNFSVGFESDGSAVGTRTDVFKIGNYIGIIAVNDIVDLQPGTGTPALPQEFTSANVTADIQIIPEPATIGLMGIAGLGMFLARRKGRR